ncbi:TPA: hypothetical protein MIW62_24765 [Klebsiella pneumoniae]|nr:hypothetical protein EAO00_17475 [Klebsiella pneumoniae]HBY5101317.1 hypothetical protein [Klebsiella pneumoniae]HBY5309759.1 hypothetical protein [Klebsiella pneumoniae]
MILGTYISDGLFTIGKWKVSKLNDPKFLAHGSIFVLLYKLLALCDIIGENFRGLKHTLLYMD